MEKIKKATGIIKQADRNILRLTDLNNRKMSEKSRINCFAIVNVPEM
jgi:hypothetical protein